MPVYSGSEFEFSFPYDNHTPELRFNQFSFSYDTEKNDGTNTSIGTNTRITIQGHPDQEIPSGAEIPLVSSIVLDTRAIPVGVNAVETIEWTDSNGVILTGPYFPSDGWHAIQVRYTYTDAALGFVYTASQDYSFHIIPPEREDHTFTFKYEGQHGAARYCNMDIMKYMTYFPSWSSTYRNFYSNTSKLFSPHFERFNFQIDDLDTFCANNRIDVDKPSYEYRSKISTVLTIRTPKLIDTEFGMCANRGEISSMSIDSIPITDTKLNKHLRIDKMSQQLSPGTNSLSLPSPCFLYIKSSENYLNDQKEIEISGINMYGDFVTESIPLKNSIPVKTLNRFYKVISANAFDGTLIISNYIQNDKSYTDRSLLEKRIAGKQGLFFTPFFEFLGTDLIVYNADGPVNTEEYKFNLPFEPDSMLISNLFDIFLLKDGEIWTSKMYLDYKDIGQINSSTNNNEFICLDEETISVGDVARIRITTDLIRKEHPICNFRFRVEHYDRSYYLASNGTFTQEENTWIDISETGRALEIEYEVTEDGIIKYHLDISTRTGSFTSMSYFNNLDFTKIATGVQSMMVYDDKFIVIDPDEKHYSVEMIRRGFLSDGNRCHVHYPYDNLKLIYEEES